jgi:hypothetical protein
VSAVGVISPAERRRDGAVRAAAGAAGAAGRGGAGAAAVLRQLLRHRNLSVFTAVSALQARARPLEDKTLHADAGSRCHTGQMFCKLAPPAERRFSEGGGGMAGRRRRARARACMRGCARG